MATCMSVRYSRNWPAEEQNTRLRVKPKEQMKTERISRDLKYLLRLVQKLSWMALITRSSWKNCVERPTVRNMVKKAMRNSWGKGIPDNM